MASNLHFNKVRLDELLFENEMDKKMLAEKAGINANYLYQINSGRRSPSNKTAGAIARALGVKTKYLFFKSDVSKSTTKEEKVN